MWTRVVLQDHRVSVYRRNVLLARHLTALTTSHITCQRGLGHVDFCDASQKKKWFGNESSFVTGKKQFCDIYGSFVTVEQTWRDFYNELKFVSKSSLSFLL